jgi:hypothetical protein
MEAEAIRDGVLAVAGRLDRTAGGPVVSHLGERAIDNDSKGGVPTDASTRRSVYLPVVRNDLPPAFEVFDFADPDVATGKRDATTVATQALYLMNSPFARENALFAAKRLLTLPTDEARLADLYRRAFCREPGEREVSAAKRYLAAYKQTLRARADADVEAWAGVCLAVFGSTEFRFIE